MGIRIAPAKDRALIGAAVLSRLPSLRCRCASNGETSLISSALSPSVFVSLSFICA
ncbi:MAG: hypothetical protein LBI57_00290 [Helicobacteraceae bacterium]|nr:hypothetical protein [Helicobacteraceae bacterium]